MPACRIQDLSSCSSWLILTPGLPQTRLVAYTVLVEKDEEGYFVATVPELRGCHTQAKSLDVLMRRVQEAIALFRQMKITQPLQYVNFRE